MKEYEAYLKLSSEIPHSSEVIEIEIRDTETFETANVKARISKNPNELNSPDKLWLNFEDSLGVMQYGAQSGKTPWFIEIVEKEKEEIEEVDLDKKKVRISLGQRRGSMIRSLLEERAAAEKEKEEK